MRDQSFVANVPRVVVYLRVTVSLRYLAGIHVHDGPGIDSGQVNYNRSVIHLSSFQAFVVIFTDISWCNKYEMYQSAFGLVYTGRHMEAT